MYELMILEPVELREDLVVGWRIRIRIQSGQWIRIWIQEGKKDPQK
jgi:hypothetical protein